MLKSEDMATEIPLPGKKADEFLDFLKILYLKEKEGIECKWIKRILSKFGAMFRLDSSDSHPILGGGDKAEERGASKYWLHALDCEKWTHWMEHCSSSFDKDGWQRIYFSTVIFKI